MTERTAQWKARHAGIVEALPNLRVLGVTGHDRSSGEHAGLRDGGEAWCRHSPENMHPGSASGQCSDQELFTAPSESCPYIGCALCLAGKVTKKALAPLIKSKAALPQVDGSVV